jgi:hypothetical protein
MRLFVPVTNLFFPAQLFRSFSSGQVPSFPVAHAEVENSPMTGVPKCLCSAGSPASASAIKNNFAGLGEISDVQIHLVHWNVNRIRYSAGLLNFGRRADIHDHQGFCSLNLLFQVGNCDAFGCFNVHMAI